MRSVKAAIVLFIPACAIGVGMATYISLNTDGTRDPVRDPQPMLVPE